MERLLRVVQHRGLPALAAILIALGAVRAWAIECGDVIEEDTTLDRDLDCAGDGLVIGAHGITLDLGGHEIRNHQLAGEPVGVRNEGFDRVTIRNGRIEFLNGIVLLGGADRNRLSAISVDTGQPGDSGGQALLIRGSTRAQVENSEFDGGHAILLEHSSGNRIVGSRTSMPYGYSALRLFSSDENEIVGNQLYGYLPMELVDSHENRLASNHMYTEDYGPATLIVRDSHENVIEMNVIRGDVAAVAFDGVRDTHVHRNEMSSQGWGGSVVVLDRVERTHFMANVLRGQASGIFLLSGQHNWLLSNTIRWEQDYGSCYRTGCDIDGIRVYPGARRTQIKRNLVHGYADDGIDVEDPTAHLRGNSVIGNRGYGIEAVPGVRGVDNSAVGGGCMNIDCRGTGDLIP